MKTPSGCNASDVAAAVRNDCGGNFVAYDPWYCLSETVLSEAEHLVFRGGGDPFRVLELLRRGALTIGLEVAAQVDRLATLQRAYRDQPMSLADACLVRLTELHARSRVFTTDSHFVVYRRNGRQVIPLLMPGR